MSTPKRKGFDPKAGSTATARPSAAKVPKVEAIHIGPAWYAPPAEVARQMRDGDQWLIGIDIETAGWKESVRNKGSFGQFGFYNLCGETDFESRVCQLGWAFGKPGQPEVTKEYLVKPDGWEISAQAFKTHKITLAHAETHGRPLAEILADFCTDAKAVADQGGRLVCHHMACMGRGKRCVAGTIVRSASIRAPSPRRISQSCLHAFMLSFTPPGIRRRHPD